ncbi:MAG: DNA (cytosine-5-)-methyltransferase [Verrucomicrobia bacterium]|nr:DNA (cytosine-5-)-methyltransferase [Verrucomicrobiota bacterium]
MQFNITSLFSGIGGLEYGFHKAGHNTQLFCENDPAAQKVLRHRFPDVRIESDICNLSRIPKCDVLTAGFPCQDLSQAGGKVGISGPRSGLVSQLFRLVRESRPRPTWIVVENVPYMLSLGGGAAMRILTQNIEELGYKWCYRTIDARCFGIPQRRPRVLFLACRDHDPKNVLLTGGIDKKDVDGKPSEVSEELAYGFYWTEGSRGVGWTREGVPPIKGGSTIGIPSPPAVWIPRDDFAGTITIRDAERLQGFPRDWTISVEKDKTLRKNSRWRLVGNAVNTELSIWLAQRFAKPGNYDSSSDPEWTSGRWPSAAWGGGGKVYVSGASTWPASRKLHSLSDYLSESLKPLSERATRGFLSRAKICTNVVYSNRFLNSLEIHANKQ